jgi:hypothetical protein
MARMLSNDEYQKRNQQIVDAVLRGESLWDLSRVHGLSMQRIKQIANVLPPRKRVTPRAPSLIAERYSQALQALRAIEQNTDDPWVRNRAAFELDREEAETGEPIPGRAVKSTEETNA